MINLTAHLNITRFGEVANGLSREDRERIAAAFPGLFASAFEFGDVPTQSPEPTKPGPAKTRHAKTEPPIDKAALRQRCHAYVLAHPASKAEEVAGALHIPPHDRDAFGKAVKAALESLVDEKALSCEGERRGRKYTVMTPRAQEPEAAE